MAAATIGVVGAGAMGAGIAQVAAVHGHPVLLADALPAAMARARTGHQKAMAREVDKGRLSREAADAVLARLTYVEGVSAELLAAFAPCDLVIEAIVEKLDAKQALLRTLEGIVAPAAVLASNTSSLSIAALAGACTHKTRVVGVHFFNPAPVMPLVEIIPAISTAPDVTARATAYAAGWKKVTVLASDTPGFIVNRVARPFYGESLRLLEEGVADPATIDHAMRTLGGFRMGPCELMDFIGHDINFAVTKSVWEQTFHEPRYRPSLVQQRLVEAGWLGKKAGRGFYDHAQPLPAGGDDQLVAARVFGRIIAMLVNEACEAVFLGVATPADVELAMTRGVNYPQGLLAWGDALGPQRLVDTLRGLQQELGPERYRPSAHLVRRAAEGRSLLA